MNQQQCQQLKEKIQELVPDTMELEPLILELVYVLSGQSDVDKIKKFIEVFGRDIRLADVLIALNKLDMDNFYVGIDGEIFKHTHDDGVYQAWWNLALNNLNDQSDETKEWLWEVLCKKQL